MYPGGQSLFSDVKIALPRVPECSQPIAPDTQIYEVLKCNEKGKTGVLAAIKTAAKAQRSWLVLFTLL